MIYPGSKDFAFTILDDTDGGNLGNIYPIYKHLDSIGLITTKTVWPLKYDDHLNSPYMHSSTLSDTEYLDFILWLRDRGFEVTWHGPTMESSVRTEVIKALKTFKKKLGYFPSLHVNHASNRDNLYWGRARFDSQLLKLGFKFLSHNSQYYSGEKEGSDFYWGDYAEKYIKYCRAFTFKELNCLKFNPSMPFQDPARSLVNYWFSSSSVDNVVEFERYVTKETIDNLVADKGICILSTHLAKGFCRNGMLRDSVKRILDYIASKNGWFVPVSEILDWRLSCGYGYEMTKFERRSQEFRWLAENLSSRIFQSKKSRHRWWKH
ncbi:hypothetical protein ACVBEJ_11185 [Porticoccus sp. GXU_MW_L64]